MNKVLVLIIDTKLAPQKLPPLFLYRMEPQILLKDWMIMTVIKTWDLNVEISSFVEEEENILRKTLLQS